MWIYIRTEPGVYTVGFEDSKGDWHTDSDHDSREEANTIPGCDCYEKYKGGERCHQVNSIPAPAVA